MTDERGVALVPLATLLANPRGVAFAAFASRAQIAALLGVSEAEAGQFQANAQSHFHGMMAEARRGRA